MPKLGLLSPGSVALMRWAEHLSQNPTHEKCSKDAEHHVLRPAGPCLPCRLLAGSKLSSAHSSWPCGCCLTAVTRLVSEEGKWSSRRVAASGSFVQLK